MKKFIIVLLVFVPLDLNAQWQVLNEGFKGSINTIDFISENVGWIAGSNGTLVKTTDGGENWINIPIDENWNISQIDFINESVGWAIGGAYIDPNWISYIWKTSDGGNTWVQQFSSAVFGYNSIYVIDATNVFAVGGNKIYKTTNGGTNWINVSPNILERNYNSLWFQDSQTGVVTGNYNDGVTDRGVILKTTNGGTTWTETIVNEFNNISDLQFLDQSNGYFKARKDTVHYLCKTTDIMTSWNVIKQIPASDWRNPITSYQFIDNNLAYSIISDTTSLSYKIVQTTDGGLNWQTIQIIENVFLDKIYINNQNYSFISGSFPGGPSILFKRIDTENWIIQRFSYPLTDVCFWDKDKGIYTGILYGFHFMDGFAFFTINGGVTTNNNFFNTGGGFEICFIRDENVVFTLGWWRGICKTVDYGVNWNVVYENNFDSTGFDFWGNDICFVYEQEGFVVGTYSDSVSQGGGILFTMDGGESWVLYWRFPNATNYEYNLKSIHFIETTGWSVGDGGMIAKYTPQTGWVKQTSVTDLPLNKVFFTDENYGWIAGGYHNDNDFHPILLKTTNGGVNWNTVPNVPYLIRDFAFIDNNLGWAIGYTETGEGGILKTTDGGITWVVDSGNLSSKLNALFIKDNYGWAVGENGLILRTTDAGPVWVEDDQTNLPTEFVLEQNYPNPFNPSTVISYRLPVISKVTLKVYDVLGREIATLVNEEQQAGFYNVEFTINNLQLSSGIYFYQLKAGDHVSTKKMILLK